MTYVISFQGKKHLLEMATFRKISLMLVLVLSFTTVMTDAWLHGGYHPGGKRNFLLDKKKGMQILILTESSSTVYPSS